MSMNTEQAAVRIMGLAQAGVWVAIDTGNEIQKDRHLGEAISGTQTLFETIAELAESLWETLEMERRAAK